MPIPQTGQVHTSEPSKPEQQSQTPVVGLGKAEQSDIEAMAEELIKLSTQLNETEYRFLSLLGQFDQHTGRGKPIRSTARWLRWQCGFGLSAARERIRVARALRKLPKISRVFEYGELSYDQVRSMTRVVTPEQEAYRLRLAQHGTARHLERLLGPAGDTGRE